MRDHERKPVRTGSYIGYLFLLLGLAVLLTTTVVVADDFVREVQIRFHMLRDDQLVQFASYFVGGVLVLMGLAVLPRRR